MSALKVFWWVADIGSIVSVLLSGWCCWLMRDLDDLEEWL